MKNIVLTLVVLLASAASAQAACYADYQASKDNPLQLQYGVAEIYGPCTLEQAQTELSDRLASDGWRLLQVMGTFDESGLEGRRASAGTYFLRY